MNKLIFTKIQTHNQLLFAFYKDFAYLSKNQLNL